MGASKESRALRGMGMGARGKTKPGMEVKRWPGVLVILCLAFLLQVDRSLGQSRNSSTSPPPPSIANAPPPPYRSPPAPPSPGSSPPLASSMALSRLSSTPPAPPWYTGLQVDFSPSGAPLASPESPEEAPPPENGSTISPPPSVPPSPSTTSSSSSSSPKVGLYVGIAVAVVVVAIVALGACCCICRKKTTKNRGPPPSNPPLIHYENDEVKASAWASSSFYNTRHFKRGTRFSYGDLYAATNGFTEELGNGAFGVVYKGRLPDETDVAVKKLLDRQRGLQDFSAEVRTLGRINHGNLVALRGFCYEQNQPFLVYEYVANGSLDKWIFEEHKADARYVMPWKLRVRVLKGTAKGLAYLHEELQIGQAVVHLDVKPENILLDDQFVPKVADFGLAKLLGTKLHQTRAAGGTPGYMAPEVPYGAATPKMDVYSFGVVLLEVLSGRRVWNPTLAPPDSRFLPAWAVRKVLDGKPLDVIDPLLKSGEVDDKEAIRLVTTALLCLPRDADERPGMSEVLRMIEGIVEPRAVPPSLPSFLEMAEQMHIRTLQQGLNTPGTSEILKMAALLANDPPSDSNSMTGTKQLSSTRSFG